jgi:hypothetical protein
MPYRRAVAATWRGACKLSSTILSFSPSDQRRRRPVSTTSSRSTWALRLPLSIRTVLNSALHSARGLQRRRTFQAPVSDFQCKHPASAARGSLLRIVTLEQRRIVFVHLDEFGQALNAEVGERQDAVFSDAIDPDDTVLDFHLAGDVPQPILVFAELFGNAGDSGDVMDLVDVRGHAARTKIADAGGVQFQGSNSSSRGAG